MVTMYDIAKEVGCAVSSVSKAFNNAPDISEKLRKKIFEVAERLDYVPNINASALTTKKNYLVGVIFSDNLNIGIEHYFYSGVLEGFKKEMETYGYDIVFVGTNLGKRNLSYLKHCKFRGVDGVLILTYDNYDEGIYEVIESGIPVVTTDAAKAKVCTVVSDDHIGGRMATKYIVDLGHKDIACITGPIDTQSAKKRLLGYEEVMKESGLVDFTRTYNAKLYSFESGKEALDQLFEEGSVPEAIVVGSDHMAMGVIEGLNERGFSVPEDVSVIGYDDINLAKHLKEPLTTIKQDSKMIGKTAAVTLYDIIENKTSHDNKYLSVELIERATCKRK